MGKIPLRVWLLRSGSSKQYMYLQGYLPDSNYWERNFHAMPMPDDWELPPLKIIGKTKKLGDSVGWTLGAPVISDRARKIFEPIVGDSVQFVRFHDLHGKPYFGMNVLRVEAKFLDTERSRCDRQPNGEIAYCSRYVFRSDLPDELPPVFKISSGSDVFVTSQFAREVTKHGLTGFCLQDPGENAFELMANDRPLNAYPGLI